MTTEKRTRTRRTSAESEILMRTISQMPKVFTSNEFNVQAIQNGYSEEKLKRSGLSEFLRRYSDNKGEYSKTWTKKDFKERIVAVNRPIESELTESKAIAFLKSKGYKVMKPVSEWLEC